MGARDTRGGAKAARAARARGEYARWVAPVFGLVCALPEELGPLASRARDAHPSHGSRVLAIEVGGALLLACVSGVGPEPAARAAEALVAAGARAGILVVGTCGGLRRDLRPGTLVHCARVARVDARPSPDREIDSDSSVRAAWLTVAPGTAGWFLTVDRPVTSMWRRFRLARAYPGPCVAEMETAAVARIARRAAIPWAALRAVTDRADGAARASFRHHYRTQAGRAADTVEALIRALAP